LKSDQKLRITKQRQLILEELKKVVTHPTADEIYRMVRERMPRVSLGTVYRNLETLSGFATAAETLAASRLRPIVPILPVMVERDGRRSVVIPADAGYPALEERIGEVRG
jgi:hypothetical protein